MVMSATLFLNQISIALSNYLSVPLVEWSRDLFFPFYVTAVICFGSFLSAYVVYLIDTHVEKKGRLSPVEGEEAVKTELGSQRQTMSQISQQKRLIREDEAQDQIDRKDRDFDKNELSRLPNELNSEQVDLEKPLMTQSQHQKSLTTERAPAEPISKKNLKITLFDLLTFRSIALLLSYALIASIYYQLIAISMEMLIRRYSFSLKEVKNLMAIFSLESAVSMPFIGIFFNYYPGRVVWGFISGVLTVVGFAFFLVLGSKCGAWIHIPLLLVSQFGAIAFIVCNSMMSLSLPSRSVGVLFGPASVLESILCSIQPVVLGQILKNQNFEEFQIVLKIFLGLSVAYLGVNLGLMVFDLRNGGLLYMKESDSRVEKLREKLAKKSEFLAKRKQRMAAGTIVGSTRSSNIN